MLNQTRNDFHTEKILILCSNYETLPVKQPDIVSSIRPETKPLLSDLSLFRGQVQKPPWAKIVSKSL